MRIFIFCAWPNKIFFYNPSRSLFPVRFTIRKKLVIVFLVILMGFSIIHSISTPINKLIATTKELAAGNLSASPPAQGGDEIGVLAEAISAMADQLQNLFITLEKKVAERTQALSEEQEFVSAVLETTHALVMVFDPQGKIVRFNKACREITGYAFPEVKNKPVWELLMRPEHAETYRTQVEKFKKDGLFDTHENYWITEKGTQRLMSWFHTGLRDPKGTIVHIVATGIDITERRKMEQVIYNLVINAKEAIDPEGPVRIWLENVSVYEERSNYILEPGQYIRIVIQDEGRGIPEKHLPLLFDPYFSTKERGSQKGMGLGLTTAYSIIKKHDGHIDLASKVGMGTTFYIYLPANQPKP